MTESPDGPPERRGGLLPWIAAERAVRAVLLVLVGAVLVTHTNTDYGRDISRLAQHLGFDPASNGIRRLSGAAERLSPAKIRFYGVVAIAYGLLEAVESYGLFRRRRWAEYLTVVATVLLFVPEIDELVKKPSLLKVGAISSTSSSSSIWRSAYGAPAAARSRRRTPTPIRSPTAPGGLTRTAARAGSYMSSSG